MKNTTLLLLFLSLFMTACQSVGDKNKIPEKLEDKRTLLRKQKDELRSLERKIADLEAAIEKQDPSPKRGTLVTTMPVKRTDFERFVEIQANVEANELVAATSETPGRIVRLTVDEGDLVRKGQLIAALDLESIDKQEAEIRTSLGLAKEVYERQKRLWDQNIGSEIQYLQAKNNVERLEQSLNTLAFQKSKANVYAPISGSVEMVMTQQGEMASPGMPIVQIQDARKVNVVAEAPETYLTVVERGQLVKVHFPAINDTIEAKISRIGRTINPANRTFKVEIDLPNSDGSLKPNLLAIVYVSDYKAEDIIVIPRNLVQQEVGGKNYVFVVGQDERGKIAEKRYITTGNTSEGLVEITDGLKTDDLLINDGARIISENQHIEINAAASPDSKQ